MIRRIIADFFRDLSDFQICICQETDRIRHSKLCDQIGKAIPGVLFKQRTQIWFTVVEELCQLRQSQRLVVMLDILQHQGKVRPHLIIIKLQCLTVTAQKGGE